MRHLMFPTGVSNSPITATDATVAPQQSIEFLRALAAQLQNAQNAQAQQTNQLMQNFSQVQPSAAHVAQQIQVAAQHVQSASVLQQLQVNNHLRSQSQQIAQQHQQHVEAHQQQAQAIIQAHASFALQHAALSRASQPQSVTAVSTHSGTATSSLGQKHIEESHRRPSLMSNFFPQPVLQNSNVNQQPSIVKDDKAQLCVDTGVPSGAAHGITKAEPSPGGATPQSIEKDSEEQAEKKAMSDRLEAIERERKQADQQVEALIKRCERYRNVKKESEQDIKLEPINGEAEETENMPLWEKIIMENKKKVVEARTRNPFLSNLPPMSVMPLYHEPRDAPGMAELLERHKEFRPQLVQMLVERKRAEDASNRCTLEKYNVLLREWTKKVEKWESSPKKLVRDAKHREIFERTFPELKKQREDKERSGRNERINLRVHDTTDFLTIPGERVSV
uniref:Uncharacterized protein n=1 Tax=Heterorhabditis bacteriophora TaxID=37862 RepID=A0A1I7XQR3_HETBA